MAAVMAGSPIFADIVLLLALSIPAVLVFRWIRLPSVAGFLVVGVLVGPHALGWLEDAREVEPLAELGVALLLFTIGLDFSLPRLLLQGRRLFLGGSLQVAATVLLVAFLGRACALSWPTAIVCGFLAALSSTAFVLKLLHDTRQVDAPQGQFSVGILLFQDLIVVLMILLVPLLGGADTGASEILLAIGKALAAILAVVLFARHGFPRLAALVVRLGGRELFVLFVALVALGAAWLTQSLGLSVALGTFVAGLCISESEYSHQVVSEVVPFRDVFNALFFISIGMLLDVPALLAEARAVTLLVAVLIVVKAGVVCLLGLWLARSARVAFAAGLALAQIGEFSFIIAQVARDHALLSERQTQLFLAVAVASMFLTPFLFHGATRLLEARPGGAGARDRARDAALPAPVVLIVGYGLNGRNLARALRASDVPFRVLEMNPDTVQSARAEGVPILFGDAGRLETLRALGAEGARILVFAISDPAATRRGVTLARRLAPQLHIIVRTRFMTEREELHALGANEVIPEEFETSIEIFRCVLRRLHVPPGSIAVQAALIRREGYRLLRGARGVEEGLESLHAMLRETLVDSMAVSPHSSVAGRSLGELNLRARTGVLVVSAVRHGQVMHTPGPGFTLQPDDILTVAGTAEGIEGFRAILSGAPPAPPDEPRGAGL